MDINAIAGTLKLYFRELPEPLLTDRLYPAFMEGIGERMLGVGSSSAGAFLPFVLDERHRRGLKLKSGSHMFPPPSLVALSDPAAKENCMMHLLRSLPDPNLMTFLTLLEHLKRYRLHTHTHLLITRLQKGC